MSKTFLALLLAFLCVSSHLSALGGGGMSRRRILAALAKSGGGLPVDSFVEYIEGPTQDGSFGRAFDSGYIVRNGDRIEASFRILKFNASGTCLLGLFYNPNVRMSMIHIVNSAGLHPWIGITNGYTCNQIPLEINVDYTCEINIGNEETNVSFAGVGSQTISASRDFELDSGVIPCGLMARNNNGQFENFGVFRIYNLKVFRAGALFKNFIPSRIGSEAVLYEGVAGTVLLPWSGMYSNGDYNSNLLNYGEDIKTT